MSTSLLRVLIVRVGDADPSRVARSVRDAGSEAILLDEPNPSPADVVSVALQEDVGSIIIVVVAPADTATTFVDAVTGALAAEDAADITVSTRPPAPPAD